MVELADLSFMSSTCLSLLLRFIDGVMSLQPNERYRLRFRSNPDLPWQRRTLAVLHAFAQEIVVVE